MNKIRFVFGFLYVVLILLQVLMMVNNCRHQVSGEGGGEVADTLEVVTDDNAEETARGVGNMGKMKVTLLWNEIGDIDLHVVEPNGAHIWYSDKHPANAYGELDYDNTEGGNGSAENIYWDEPQSGRYKLYVNFYQKKLLNVDCRVLVFINGELVNTYTCTLRRQGEMKSLPDIVL